MAHAVRVGDAKLRKWHIVSRVYDAAAAADFGGDGFAVYAACGRARPRDIRFIAPLFLSSVTFLASL